MSKTSIKIMALILTVFTYMGERGMAGGEWHHDVYTGCVAEEGAKQKCKTMCGEKYKRSGPYSYHRDPKNCPYNDKPNGCYCDYKD